MRIAIVNDMPMAAEVLKRAVLLRKTHEIAWVACDGAEALEKCRADTPDLILMDLIMPKTDGVQATRAIMAQCPCAILIVTVSVQENARMVFEAMGAGALDAVDTPALGCGDFEKVSAPLLAKLDSMGCLLRGREAARPAPPPASPRASVSAAPLVVIGASAGGPSALAAVLGGLPRDFPSPIVIVQHVDEQFALSLAGWLKQQCALPVKPAMEGAVPVPGEVLLAVRSDHLILAGPRRLGYCAEPKEAFYRPSVDIFFESVARRWPGEVVGVLLTGMGRDGAEGLKRLRDAGFHTIAQDRATCAVYGMPKAAVHIGAAVEVLPLQAIAASLCKRCRPSR
ncbi:MAG: chemotaxis response regulator protein-glutamate methylesterase [Chthoniobacteraceae bacterium]|nr:chemotaxis response regulator protein-glutamate methylesterase [Chthoniobacteraceae bacterium]